MQFIREYWQGKKPLWKAFWLYGVLGNAIILLFESFQFASFAYSRPKYSEVY